MPWIYKSSEREKGFGEKFIKSRLNYKKGDYNEMNTYFNDIKWEN